LKSKEFLTLSKPNYQKGGYKVYTAKVTSKGQITLPKEVRIALKIEEGERVLIMPDPVTGAFYFSNTQNVKLSPEPVAVKLTTKGGING